MYNMGSLPNLHELEQIERRRERRREREQRDLQRAERARENSHHERERLATFAQRQSPYNAYLMAGLGMGGGTIGMAAAAAGGVSGATGGPTTSALGGLAIGGAAVLSLGTPGLLGGPHHHLHSHTLHRHSLTTRHRVLRTRSSGAAHNIWDDQMLEHLAAYSPVSTRSHRINPVSSFQVQAALAASRRRESLNSSIGANSIRRLITLNNRNCRHNVPPQVRRKLCKNFTCLAIGHGLMCAILLPILGLQGSNSIWHHREPWLPVGPNLGSLLLSLSFLIAGGMSLATVRLIRKLGYTILVGAGYLGLTIFLAGHLYPSIFTLLPSYMLLGLTLSPTWISKIALIVHFGNRLSCSLHECTLSNAHNADSLDDHRIFCNRDQRVRRLARWFQISQDIGIIAGAIVASLILACTSSDWNCLNLYSSKALMTIPSPTNSTVVEVPTAYTALNTVHLQGPDNERDESVQLYYFDDFYNHNEQGARICGADMCPVWERADRMTNSNSNETIFVHFSKGKMRNGGHTLIAIYMVLSISAMLLTMWIGKIRGTFRHEKVKGITDTLLFAGPMAYFIGTEQAYMLADFLRAFVSCSLGISMVAGALVGMGILQCIVSCTLSMLLRHTKRIVIILAGFFFHSCLLLALSSWKPSSDDSALFYVLAASWGACNGMWETLLLALVTLNHANHIVEVTAPLQGLRFLGLGLTFAAHGFMCETPKIISLVIILVLSVPPYAMLEIRLETQRKAHLISL